MLATWQFIHYSRWIDVLPSPTLMTGHALPWTLQTALSDVAGESEECNFKQRQGLQPPKAIRLLYLQELDIHHLSLAVMRLGRTCICFHSKKFISGSGQSVSIQRLPLLVGSRPLRYLPFGTMKESWNHNSGVTKNSSGCLGHAWLVHLQRCFDILPSLSAMPVSPDFLMACRPWRVIQISNQQWV
jgi:hypothetical protein